MVKQKTKVVFKITCFLAAGLLLFSGFYPAFAVNEDTDITVNVRELLSVSLTTPTSWAVGNVDTFLRNDVHLDVTTNITCGFTASMTTKTANTSLVNTSKNTYTLPTLAASTTKTNFPANYWGYSLDDTAGGNNSSTYNALVGAGSTPITILSSNVAASGSKDIYFGAKANITQASGTYSGTVVVSVVACVDNNNPITPIDPDVPNPNPDTPTYNPGHGTTTYTTTTTNSGAGTRTTTTEVTSGDNRATYGVIEQRPSQGVTYSTTSNVSSLSTMTTGLAIASSAALTSGAFFLFAARREEEDDEDDTDEF